MSIAAHGAITEDAAKQAVRDFENDQSLALTCVEFDEDTSGPTWSHRSWYLLKPEGCAYACRLWSVHANTAEVTHASYRDLSSGVIGTEPGEPFTKDVYRPTAESFARAKYSGFDTMGFVLTTEEWIGIGWLYVWQQKVAYDALTINMVSVIVQVESAYILEHVPGLVES